MSFLNSKEQIMQEIVAEGEAVNFTRLIDMSMANVKSLLLPSREEKEAKKIIKSLKKHRRQFKKIATRE